MNSNLWIANRWKSWRTMEAPLRHINCRHLTLESADKLTNMSSRIQDTTYFAVFLQTIQGANPVICFCYFNTEGRLHRTSYEFNRGSFSYLSSKGPHPSQTPSRFSPKLGQSSISSSNCLCLICLNIRLRLDWVKQYTSME